MSRGGVGSGSATIVLVFAILSLTIFSLISYTSAGTDKTQTVAELRLLEGYYDADALAVCILEEILSAGAAPEAAHGVGISLVSSSEYEAVMFTCPISELKELHVEAVFYEDAYEIIKWKMRDTSAHEIDGSLPVWTG